MKTLKQILTEMKEFKDKDYNDEWDVYFSNGLPVCESKQIFIIGGYNGS